MTNPLSNVDNKIEDHQKGTTPTPLSFHFKELGIDKYTTNRLLRMIYFIDTHRHVSKNEMKYAFIGKFKMWWYEKDFECIENLSWQKFSQENSN